MSGRKVIDLLAAEFGVLKKILIVKTGNTVTSLREAGEDFEYWFVEGGGLTEDQYQVINVFEGAMLPEPSRYQGIIVTGSPAFVTDHEKWSEESAEFLRQAVDEHVPVLGVCYGHQLLAYALGGTVDFHARGREMGTVEIQLYEEGMSDALLGSLPSRFTAQVSHSQTVISLPGNAILLAGNEFEPHQAFRVGESAWGLQFHPEFSERIVKAYISERRDDLLRENLDPDRLLKEVRSSEHAARLHRQFVQLVFQ